MTIFKVLFIPPCFRAEYGINFPWHLRHSQVMFFWFHAISICVSFSQLANVSAPLWVGCSGGTTLATACQYQVNAYGYLTLLCYTHHPSFLSISYICDTICDYRYGSSKGFGAWRSGWLLKVIRGLMVRWFQLVTGSNVSMLWFLFVQRLVGVCQVCVSMACWAADDYSLGRRLYSCSSLVCCL